VTSRLRGATTRRALAGALGLALLSPALALAQPAEWPLTVATLAGIVEVSRARAPWARAALRDTLGARDSVRTLLQSRMTLRTANGHALRLAPLSQVVLAPAEGAGPPATAPPPAAPSGSPPTSAAPARPVPLPGPPGPVKVRLDAGWIWAAVLPLPGAPVFQIDVGSVSVVVRGSGVGIRREGDGDALVRVYHGTAAVSGTAAGQRWERALVARQELRVPGAAAPGAPRPLTREPFEEPWIRWNEEQDFAAYAGPPPPAK
jgi:hypothetical protein